jgi:hypothetical protein
VEARKMMEEHLRMAQAAQGKERSRGRRPGKVLVGQKAHQEVLRSSVS